MWPEREHVPRDRARRPGALPRPGQRPQPDPITAPRHGPTPRPTMLTSTQREQFGRDGFLVLPGFKSAADLAEVRARAQALVDAFEPDGSTGVFSTRNQARTADAALIASADQVHCFFEEEAFDAEGR